MSAPNSGLLLVSWPLPADPACFDSPYATFRLSQCDSLDDIEAALARQPADAVLIGIGRDGADAAGAWPGWADLALRAAVVVAAEAPAPEWAMRLVHAGVQDVVAVVADGVEAAGLSRILRFAIERHARERAARKAASTDLLTGLPNQSQLVEHISQLLALREREPAPMVVIALRLDGLAQAEAQFGHEATNTLRRKIAVRLRSAMRAGDVVASIGADRFAVLLPRVQSADDGARVVEKLSAALHLPVGLAGREVSVTVAAGVAQYPRDGKDASVLLRVACDAASLAKPPGPAGAVPYRDPRPAAANDD